jgi:hypothetical protein
VRVYRGGQLTKNIDEILLSSAEHRGESPRESISRRSALEFVES